MSIQASWDAPGSPFSLVGVQRDSEGQDSASDILTEDTDPNQLLEMLEGPAPPTPTASDLERERYRARMVPVPRCLHAGDGGLVEGPCGSTRDGGVHPAGAPAPSERIEERYRGRLVPTRP